MGASTFVTRSSARTVAEAFSEAVRRAQWDHGHSGYTGTIAEKDNFILIDYEKEKLEDESRGAFMERLINDGDSRIDDKWGPAGCIKADIEETWYFFGWASE